MTALRYAAAQILRALPRERITRVVGRLSEATLPPAVSSTVIGLYSRAYDVDLDEAEGRDTAYPSFDAFFTRPLREGVRPVCDDAEAIVSPSDGRVMSSGPVHEGGQIEVKGQPYRVADLICDEADAARYDGGQFAVVYLSPRDYHRVHAPVAGEIRVVRSVAGDYYPVNSIGEEYVPQLFARNRRVAIAIDTTSMGRVTVVMVSAMIVGRITISAVAGRDVPFGVHEVSPALRVARGDEIGVFRLGSTAVLFAERGASPEWHRDPRSIVLGAPLHARAKGENGSPRIDEEARAK